MTACDKTAGGGSTAGESKAKDEHSEDKPRVNEGPEAKPGTPKPEEPVARPNEGREPEPAEKPKNVNVGPEIEQINVNEGPEPEPPAPEPKPKTNSGPQKKGD